MNGNQGRAYAACRKTKLFVVVWALEFGWPLSMSVAPADYFIYKYREDSGINLYTDWHLPTGKYTLVESIIDRQLAAKPVLGHALHH